MEYEVKTMSNNEDIITAKDNMGVKIIIDMNLLRGNKYLKGARIFNRLFKLEENNDFKKENFHVDSDGDITILSDLDINNSQWVKLISFLKFGKIFNVGYEINSILYATIRLGGIPEFDKYVEKYFKEKDDLKNYNPLKPKDDYRKMYQWAYLKWGYSYDEFIHKHNPMHGWSVSFVENVNGRKDIWYRRLNKNK
tara:strand:- start:417 stop:1001 length:585 start_codon:yes stop_codon:yes gene_type:complete